jgi:hypothetical protein
VSDASASSGSELSSGEAPRRRRSRMRTTLKRGIGQAAGPQRERPLTARAPVRPDHALPAARPAEALDRRARPVAASAGSCWRSWSWRQERPAGFYLYTHESVAALKAGRQAHGRRRA